MNSSAKKWLAMVQAEHAQTERLRDQPNPHDDHWHGMTVSFRADPHRTDDPLLDRLALHVQPHHTLIDVGSGPGRLALPLALRCRHLTAVEPSPAMAQAFLEEAGNHNIQNVSLVESTWEDAQTQPADLVLCSHVLYTARHIDRFIEKLTAHAQERVLVILFGTLPSIAHIPYGPTFTAKSVSPCLPPPNSWNSWTKWASPPTSKTCQPPNSTASKPPTKRGSRLEECSS